MEGLRKVRVVFSDTYWTEDVELKRGIGVALLSASAISKTPKSGVAKPRYFGSVGKNFSDPLDFILLEELNQKIISTDRMRLYQLGLVGLRRP